MNTRIETTHAPTRLLGELPTGWAQAIVTHPTRADLEDAPPRLFTQLHRVLRADGTLWLLCRDQCLPHELQQTGWSGRSVGWSTPLQVHPSTRVHLFVKQEHYHYNHHAADAFRTAQPLALATAVYGCPSPRQQRRELLRRCVLAGSSRTACGACGAPYTRHKQGIRPGCAHNDPRSRCLILDPFYHPAAGTHEIAAQHGRAFLGITQGEQG